MVRDGVALGALRRHVVPALLAVIALCCAAMAVRAEGAPLAVPVAEEQATGVAPGAPVLSARRVPGVLARLVAEERLADDLTELAAATPEPACLVASVGGAPPYEDDPERPVVPASTLKLLTGAAVLDHLGHDERLVTEVAADGAPVDGVVAGDLWLVGGGDPVLATGEWAASQLRQPALATSIEALADRVRDAGVRVVRGAVVGDESRYDTERFVPTWPPRYTASGQIGPLSALTVDDGFTGPGGRGFDDPAAGAAGVLTRLLRDRGVVVEGEPRAGAAPADRTRVASIASPTAAALVAQMLRDSDNGTAELLTKELGHRVRGEGSTAAGTAVIRAALDERGLPLDGVVVRDGSGLDRGNRLTCGLLHEFLVDEGPTGVLVDGLAVGGRSGTLETRFVTDALSGRIRAKTGTLRDVAALAGLAGHEDGPVATFAYVLNGTDVGSTAPSLQEELAEALLRFPEAPSVDALGPGEVAGAGS